MPTIQRFPFDAFVVAAEFLGRTPVFALGDGTVRIVDGAIADPVKVHNGAVLTGVRSLDGESLLTGGDDGLLARIHADGRVEKLSERPRKWIAEVAAGPTGAVGFGVGKVATVRLADGTEKHFEHDSTVAGLAFAPKGLRLGVARKDGVTLWWVNTAAPPQLLPEWKGGHTGITFSPDGRFVVTTMQETALHGWWLVAPPAVKGDVRRKHDTQMKMTGYPARPRSMSWTAKGRYLATSGSESAVVWPFHKDGPQGQTPLQLGPRDVFTVKVASHPKDEMVAIGYQDGAIALARFAGEALMLRPAGGDPITALTWDDSGLRLAFGTEAGSAGVLDMTS